MCQLESSSKQGTELHAFVPSDATPAPNAVVISTELRGADNILGLIKRMEARIETLETNVAQERKMKEQSDAKLRTYTITHGLALEQALVYKDASHLNQIRFRDVLNQIQAALANAVNVAGKEPQNHSGDWRQALDRVGDLTKARIDEARRLLALSSDHEKYQSVSLSEPAMTILCEKKSTIRDDGDKVAHPNLGAGELRDLLKVLPHVDLCIRQGLDIVIKLLILQASDTSKTASSPN